MERTNMFFMGIILKGTYLYEIKTYRKSSQVLQLAPTLPAALPLAALPLAALPPAALPPAALPPASLC